ncbi:MAG: hypothetical protein MZV63_05630 [Marinilabiliales bacterium]|nr:hypothetical protein [Marinilabiliales bacterium]
MQRRGGHFCFAGQAAAVRDRYLGNVVYLRGLIEYSNVCGKNCLYCGIQA